MRLQRAMVAFGLEFPYEQCVDQLEFHYGLSVSKSAVRSVVNRHCSAISGKADLLVRTLPGKGEAEVTVEADGSMLPIAVFEEGPDRRKTKKVQWREFKLCAARAQGSLSTRYGGDFCQSEAFAPIWERCALAAGWGSDTAVHGVGDGAEWIEKTFAGSFGAQGSYLLDFFHLCEYLAEAGKSAGADDGWLGRQQALLKQSRCEEVLAELELLRLAVEQDEGPICDAIRYMGNRGEQLDYRKAIEAELPIGSGMIESGHRHVLQRRLKIPGAWTMENAGNLARARIVMKNVGLNQYWEDLRAQKAA